MPARHAGSRGFESRRSRRDAGFHPVCDAGPPRGSRHPAHPHSSVGERYPDTVEAEARFLVRVPGSSGETEIMTDYESVVGGSSPPGSAFG